MSGANFKYTGRREDLRLVTGHGRYTNDWNLDGQVHAWFRRSDRAHAIIKSIDATAARAAPGETGVDGKLHADAGGRGEPDGGCLAGAED